MTDTNDIVDTEQDMLEIKCHDDYKWAAIEIKKLRNLIEQQQGAMTDTNVLINQMSALIAELEAALRHLGDEEAFPLSNDPAKTAFEALGDSYYARIEYARAALEDKG